MQIGSGHLARCLNLAEKLREKNLNVLFVCCELPGNNIELIKERKFQIYSLPYRGESSIDVSWQTDAQWVQVLLKKMNPIDYLIVDHYGLDRNWENSVRCLTKKIIVIDDLADREHDCDLLIDQNFYPDQEIRYKNLLPKFCVTLLGPEYALLSNDFRYRREKLRPRERNPNRILISFGGSDVTNETSNAIKACMQFKNVNMMIDVVVGSSNPHRELLRELCAASFNMNYLFRVNNIAELMEKADFSIGACGVMNWERCCLALPSLVITTASNQVEIAKHLASYGAIKYVGNTGHVVVDQLFHEMNVFLNDPQELRLMSQLAGKLVDGYGCHRVVEKIISLPI